VAVASADEHLVPCGHDHAALLGDDGAVVGHAGADERDGLAEDGAAVDDFADHSHEAVNPGQEVLVGDVPSGGVDARDIHDGPRAKVDAGGIYDVDVAIGQEGAVNVGGRGALDAVEHARGGAGLDELDGLLARDVETPVVDDAVVAGPDDRQVALPGESHVAADDLFPDRSRMDATSDEQASECHGPGDADAPTACVAQSHHCLLLSVRSRKPGSQSRGCDCGPS